MTTLNAALLGAALLFVIFVVAQALLPALARRGPRRALHERLSAAVARGTAEGAPGPERASALCEASEIALTELRRPRLALRYARWAHDADPVAPATIATLARAMMRAGRVRALERILWRTMDEHPDTPSHDAALDALCALYEGPLEAPERARVLRRATRRATDADDAR